MFFPFLIFAQNNLQDIINQAKSKGNITLPQGKTYTLNHPLILPSNFILNGNGCIIKPNSNWRNQNSKDSPLIEIVGGSKINISNLTLDNMASRGVNGMPSYSILILKSSEVNISSVTFKNLGLKKTNQNVGGFPFILIAAQEAPNDFTYLPKKYSSTLGSVNDVVITNCKFVNIDYVNSFAIRLLTLWTKQRKKENIKNMINGVILEGNTFLGEYDWNTIEMAGPATKNIKVLNNILEGPSINNIDVDKGASEIEIKNNIIKNAGLPFRHRLNKNVRVSPIMVHGSKNGYISENVVVINNEISGVTNPNANNSRYLYSSGIGVAYANNVVIKGNKLNSIFPDKNYGAAICLDQSIKNIEINGNYVRNVNWGIVITPNTLSFNSVNITNNDIQSKSESMLLLNGSSGEFRGLTLKGNKIESKKNINKIKVGSKIRSIDSDVRQ